MPQMVKVITIFNYLINILGDALNILFEQCVLSNRPLSESAMNCNYVGAEKKMIVKKQSANHDYFLAAQ